MYKQYNLCILVAEQTKMSVEDPQNKMIFATGGYDHTIHFWLAHSGVRQFSVQHPSSVSL